MKLFESKPIAIKDWLPADRPRERMLSKGAGSLSDADLIALLLRTGTQSLSAVDIARNLLQYVNADLNDLAKLAPKDLMRLKGIGEAKAIAIVAALELGRRRKQTDELDKIRICGSADAYRELFPHMCDLMHEEFWLLLLNRNNRVMGKQQISLGGVASTVADPKIIFRHAIESLASSIIIAHNHPSANLNPSAADISLTKKLIEGAKLLEITLVDHIIIAGQKYFSFADEGLL